MNDVDPHPRDLGDRDGDRDQEPLDPRRVDAVFQRALGQPEQRRPRFLTRACGGDAALRTAVERLLRAERESLNAFDAAIASNRRAFDALSGELGEAPEDSRAGQQLGPFRLVRQIGEGGMAVVYLGERDDGAFVQQVAVKILRRSLDAGDDIARFRSERQILSSLEHPHIARLIDGGSTPDGLPYLVTEFIDGVPITDYCRSQALGVKARIQLFLQVVDAVHHAHRNLVVHRDLKPSNVLVDASGRARLLDFGIAKALRASGADRAPATRVDLRVMTPEYAAPEQRVGAEITTATDVYQLGVLLFELLTGTRPGGETTDAPSKASTRVARAPLPDTAPPMPKAALVRRLRGDLDVVLQTALQPDPSQRYASAAALAADLRNHLLHRPIAARPEGTLAMCGRLARRSPLATGALTALALLLVAWLASLQMHARELAHERDVAQAQSQRATRAYDLLLGVFQHADPLARGGGGGTQATVWSSLDATAESARINLRDEPATLADLLSTLARLYRASGRAEQSQALLVEALSLHRQTAGPQSAEVAVTLAELGSVAAGLGRREAAAAYLGEAVSIARTLPRAQATEAVAVFLDAGHTAVSDGDAQSAVRHFQYAESLLREAGITDGNDLIETLFGLGNALNQLGQPAQAEAPILDSLGMAERLYGLQHSRLAGPLSALGGVQRALGRHGPAARSLRRAIIIMERDYGPDDIGVLSARNNLALALGAAGDHAGEQAELRRLIAIKTSKHGPDDPGAADNYQNLGASLALAGDHAAALQALDIAQRVYDKTLPDSSPRRAFPRITRARVLLDQQHPAAAEVSAREASAVLVRTLPAGHFAIGIAQCLQAEARAAQGDAAGAAALVTRAWPLVQAAPPEQADHIARCRAVMVPSTSPQA